MSFLGVLNPIPRSDYSFSRPKVHRGHGGHDLHAEILATQIYWDMGVIFRHLSVMNPISWLFEVRGI